MDAESNEYGSCHKLEMEIHDDTNRFPFTFKEDISSGCVNIGETKGRFKLEVKQKLQVSEGIVRMHSLTSMHPCPAQSPENIEKHREMLKGSKKAEGVFGPETKGDGSKGAKRQDGIQEEMKKGQQEENKTVQETKDYEGEAKEPRNEGRKKERKLRPIAELTRMRSKTADTNRVYKL
eukprot:TRINITY_DN2968_c0_g1_i12.p1 TRINITY_DN2968_c0_g1~~TRINITY_DN2968_c0_g1_i12.p1  ORF type:complete len:178 (+),score=57.60 TRINITY_DN2968_c0_g1_i12:213-746(+)